MANAMGEVNQEIKMFPLQYFKLYQTRAKFYMIGSDKNKKWWKILKIDRLETSKLIINEDPNIYSNKECTEILKTLNAGNLSTGGLMYVTECYGIVGFIKFLEPYYMILIRTRRKIASICGHKIYRICQSQIIRVAHSTVLTNLANSKDEQRYMKLLSMVDISKDFFFSYTYHIMWSLQKNLTEDRTNQMAYECLFVWNEFLTRSIRRNLNSTQWTVALVYGFLKQAKISLSGRVVSLTLIARRSRYYAGTRYLKRGVNDKGRVANDVETEQIVFEDESGGCPKRITSVVQNRGSIPLYWSQEGSWRNVKPDIILHKKDPTYRATQLHFENLFIRYGSPIIVLNLIKAQENRPREAILCEEFARAVDYISDTVSDGNHLKYIHWDFDYTFKRNKADVLPQLQKWASWALHLTGLFYSEITLDEIVDEEQEEVAVACRKCFYTFKLKCESLSSEKKPLTQHGVLRTNCIDCLDRTNVAQYAFGLAALRHQLKALGLMDTPRTNPDGRLVEELMGLYEKMGDTLALQYGGSAAHNKVFSLTRDQWTPATHSQQLIRNLQRYYRNSYLDPVKQDAINVFLGYFRPQHGKPALWELESDQHYNIGRRVGSVDSIDSGSLIKRSLSDGDMVNQDSIQDTAQDLHSPFDKEEKILGVEGDRSTSENTRFIGNQLSSRRRLLSTTNQQLFSSVRSSQHRKDKCKDSQFSDIDGFASSSNSCDDEPEERFPNVMNCAVCLSENDMEDDTLQAYCILDEDGGGGHAKWALRTKPLRNDIVITKDSQHSTGEFSRGFDHWVHQGKTFSS